MLFPVWNDKRKTGARRHKNNDGNTVFEIKFIIIAVCYFLGICDKFEGKGRGKVDIFYHRFQFLFRERIVELT